MKNIYLVKFHKYFTYKIRILKRILLNSERILFANFTKMPECNRLKSIPTEVGEAMGVIENFCSGIV